MEKSKQIGDHDAQFYWARIKEPKEDNAYIYWRQILSGSPSSVSYIKTKKVFCVYAVGPD